jgi:hypothetical protein
MFCQHVGVDVSAAPRVTHEVLALNVVGIAEEEASEIVHRVGRLRAHDGRNALHQGGAHHLLHVLGVHGRPTK